MIFAVDVHYSDSTAHAAGILFSDWASSTANETILADIPEIAKYEPGSFYKRELPCIQTLLAKVTVDLQAIIVDGYVTLNNDQQAGLGMHLYEALDKKIPVIGVAKKAFKDTPEECQIFRGNSNTPLYVTSVAMPLSIAKNHILNMHGEHRIPTLLKKVDQLCRAIHA